MQKPNWREKYVSILMFLIGFIYLALQIFSLVSSKSSSVSFEGENVVLNRNQFLSDLRTYATVVLFFAGAILLWRQKSLGWILGVAVICLFILIAGSGLVSLFRMKEFDLTFALVAFVVGLLLFAIFCLLNKSTRNKYRIKPAAYVMTVIVFAALAVFYFFLQ